MLCLAEALAKESFQPVSSHRLRYLLTRYRKSKARTITLFFSNKDGNTGIGTAGIILEYLLKFERSRQSQPSRKRRTDVRTHAMG